MRANHQGNGYISHPRAVAPTTMMRKVFKKRFRRPAAVDLQRKAKNTETNKG